jgi:3-phosphoshikimate 1-carboxyvinyltransferase
MNIQDALLPTPVGIIANMRILPARRIAGRVRLPGDKSVSHRAAIIASLANGSSSITNFATGADCAATVSCLKALGVSIQEFEGKLVIEGAGQRGLRPPTTPLDCGNSGSTMRMLAGVLAGQDFESTLTGDESLNARPMRRVIEPLELMDASVRANDGKPPLKITGANALKAINYDLPIASAQVKSCILLAALHASGQTVIMERQGISRDHTERMLQWFGCPVTRTTDDSTRTVGINGPVNLSAREVDVPGDVSSAAFFVAATSLLPDSDLWVEGVGLNPTRIGFIQEMRSMGARIEVEVETERCNEPVGSIRVQGRLSEPSVAENHSIAGNSIAQLIDELPLLAVVGTQIRGGLEIRNANELRFKESDRIALTVQNLRAMGANVKEFDDGLRVKSGPLHGARIEPHGDHRIAMAFTVAALIADGESEIVDADCVGVSFPEFFSLLELIIER